MGKSRNSFIINGTRGNPQGTFSQGNADAKARELAEREKKNQNDEQIEFNTDQFRYEDSKDKYESYLLNINHIDGGSKAKFLSETLGYNKCDGLKLHQAICESIGGCKPNIIEKTEFGVKYKFYTKIKGNNGKYEHAKVTIVVQRDNGKFFWRIITLVPRKNDK